VAGLLGGPRSVAAVAAATLLIALLARPAPLALAAVAALLAGAAIADARLQALDATGLAAQLGHPVDVRAVLLEHPRRRSFGVRVAAVTLATGPGRGERVLVRAPAHVRWPAGSLPGVQLRVRGKLDTLGEFDAAERRRNAHALLRAARIDVTGRRRGGVGGVLDGVRSRAERSLTRGVPGAQGALARGMVLGQDGALPDELREDFRVTGLAHLVAASGSNVLLLATLVLALGAACGLGLSARLWLAVVLVVAYVPLAGGGPSIQRAGVMGVAGLVAALAGRPASRWYALLLAAGVTLARSPRAAEDPGWQLSFAAVIAMLWIVPGLARALRRGAIPRGFAEVLAITAAATLGTAPLIALHFERLSLVSLPVNLLAAPAVAPVMWLGTIAGGLGQVAPALAEPVAGLAALPLGYLTWLAERAAALPFAELRLRSPGVWGAVAAYVAAGAASLVWRQAAARRAIAPRGWRGRAGRRLRWACMALAGGAAVAAALLGTRTPAPPTDLTVSFLDIGQGDATLIQHGGSAVLVDTGPPDGPILDLLRRSGVRRLDVLAVSHAALDHDGAAAAVLREIDVGLVLDGEEAIAAPAVRRRPAGPFGARAATPVAQLADRAHIRRLASDAGQVLRAGPLELRVLWPRREPAAPPGAEPNDRATVLHVRDGDFDLLLTADAESDVTAGLDLPVVDALKVAHHGSDDAGLPGLLQRVRPRVAVIPVGRNNLYGHPTPATVAALAAAVPVVRRTDRDGTVRLRVHAGRMTVERDP